MYEFDLDAAGLGALAGSILSLIFAYVPWVKDWFDGLDARIKPILNAGILLVVSWGYLAFKCNFGLECLELNAARLFTVFFAAMFANMSTYTTFVRQVKQAK